MSKNFLTILLIAGLSVLAVTQNPTTDPSLPAVNATSPPNPPPGDVLSKPIPVPLPNISNYVSPYAARAPVNSTRPKSWATYNKGDDKPMNLLPKSNATDSKVVSIVPDTDYFATVPQSSFDQVFTGSSQPDNSSEPQSVKAVMNFIDSTLMDIIWCGDESQEESVLFILSEKNTLYRSVDNAFSGQVLTSHLNQLGKAELEGESGQVGEVSRMLQSPVDRNMVLFLGTHGVNWITQDCGASFRAMNQGRKVDDFQFHPIERDWLLASAWTICDDFEDGPCLNYKELFVTKNLGVDWTQIGKYVIDFAWAHQDIMSYQIPMDRVIVSHDVETKGDQTTGKWKKRRQVAYSDDYFKTTIQLVKGGNKFLLTSDYLMVVKIADEDKQHVTLLVGNPRSAKYQLRPIEFPNKKINEHGYTVVDSSEDSVFLHIDHKGSNTPFGHLYVSDSTGVRYSRALKYNVKDTEGQCDFERVQGIDGVYLANVFDESVARKYTADEQGPSTGVATQTAGTKKAGDRGAKPKIEDSRRTVISFNKGNTWDKLTPPTMDADGKRIVCRLKEDCSLHLHSTSSSRFGPFYTTETSLGLVLGTGNVGAYLSTRPDEVNTYLSRDAGLTWFEVAKGSHIYEVGDHGGLIVMASNQNATRSILYSWNEGMTWNRLTISNSFIQIVNIITEPTNVGEKFIIYGREASGVRGVIIALDFSSLHQRICENPENPDTPESDYETWTPNGKISPECLLGKKITYTRRKRESQCFNQEMFEVWQRADLCECTEDDWECDFGYERKGNGPCLPIDEKTKEAAIIPPEQCSKEYFMTQGYRKVAGNLCMGGIDHHPIRLPCPGTRLIDSKTSLWLVVAAILSLFIYLKRSAGLDHIERYFRALKAWAERLTKDPRKHGYSSQIPDTLRDDDEAFTTNQLYDEETEEVDEIDVPQYEAEDPRDESRQKRMTQSGGHNAANKHVPLLRRPDDR